MIRACAGGLLALSLCAPVLGETGSVESAAARFVKGVEWQKSSALAADFTCRGNTERAILGISKQHIVVAIFHRGLQRPPEVLRYSATARNPKTTTLEIEDMDFDPKDFERNVGYLPAGIHPSKTCKGLNMSDGEVDSAHIYWNHDAKRFEAWVL